MSPSVQAFRISREVGPWRARETVSSVTSVTDTDRPCAFSRIQRRVGSAAVQRNVVSASRDTVPSSMTLPCPSHQCV